MQRKIVFVALFIAIIAVVLLIGIWQLMHEPFSDSVGPAMRYQAALKNGKPCIDDRGQTTPNGYELVGKGYCDNGTWTASRY